MPGRFGAESNHQRDPIGRVLPTKSARIAITAVLVTAAAYVAGSAYFSDHEPAELVQRPPVERTAESGVTTAEADLRAQQDMARAAWAMVMVSILSTIVGAAGVGAVIFTIRQNKDSLRQLRTQSEMTRRQTRAYLHISTVQYIAEEWQLTVAITLRNEGQTPANAIRAVCNGFADRAFGTIITGPSSSHIYFQKALSTSPYLVPDNTETIKIALQYPSDRDYMAGYGSMPDDIINILGGKMPPGFTAWATLTLEGTVSYEDVYGVSHLLTWRGELEGSKIGKDGNTNVAITA